MKDTERRRESIMKDTERGRESIMKDTERGRETIMKERKRALWKRERKNSVSERYEDSEYSGVRGEGGYMDRSGAKIQWVEE